MDWYREGRTAALNGYTLKEGKTPYIDKCQEDLGVAMDNVGFERGFNAGLNELCTPEGIQALKAKGKYQETCKNGDEAPMVQSPSRETELKERVADLETAVK